MVFKLFCAWVLIALTVLVHTIGLFSVVVPQARAKAQRQVRFWSLIDLVIRVTALLILLHCIEISIWALFYYWQGCMPTLEASFYFSGVTYSTVGYGDLVLPDEWRLLGPVEGLAGILMCGLSTGFFFAFVSKEIWPKVVKQ